MASYSKLKLNYLWKMRGYPQFSIWIPRALAKFCFLRIHVVLNDAKNIPLLISTADRKSDYLEMRRTYA